MAYLLNNSNLFAIQSAISEFKRVIFTQNQEITTLKTAISALEIKTASNTSTIAGQASSIASNTSTIAGQVSSIASNTTNITTFLDELAATNRTVTANTTVLSTIATNVGNLQPVVAGHTASLAALQNQVTTNTSDIATKTTQISVLDSISAGHTTSIGNNYNEIFRLNGVSLNHEALLAGLRTDVDSGGGSQADIAALQSDLSTVNTTLAAHDARISYNLSVFTGFLGASQSLITRLDTVEADISTINTTLTAHDSRIFTNTTDVFQLQTNGHGGRLNSIESTLTAYNTRITSNTVRGDDLLNASQFNNGLISAIDGKIITLRADVDANNLSNTQFLNALQFQSTSIFAIDQAIAILNTTIDSNLIRLGILETTQVTHDGLIREFDQEFNDPASGVIFKLDSLTTTYNTHIDSVFLTIRQNVDSNNLILGTLSTHTTSLLTAMTQVTSRVQFLEDNAPPPPPSNFDLFDEYPGSNYVSGGVIQTSSNITVEEALEIGLTISNLHAIVHNVGGTTFFCGPGGSVVAGESSTRTTFVKK